MKANGLSDMVGKLRATDHAYTFHSGEVHLPRVGLYPANLANTSFPGATTSLRYQRKPNIRYFTLDSADYALCHCPSTTCSMQVRRSATNSWHTFGNNRALVQGMLSAIRRNVSSSNFQSGTLCPVCWTSKSALEACRSAHALSICDRQLETSS